MMKQTISFLDKSTQENQEDTYSVYKKKTTDNGWGKSLNPYIIDKISEDLKSNGFEEYLF